MHAPTRVLELRQIRLALRRRILSIDLGSQAAANDNPLRGFIDDNLLREKESRRVELLQALGFEILLRLQGAELVRRYIGQQHVALPVDGSR